MWKNGYAGFFPRKVFHRKAGFQCKIRLFSVENSVETVGNPFFDYAFLHTSFWRWIQDTHIHVEKIHNAANGVMQRLSRLYQDVLSEMGMEMAASKPKEKHMQIKNGSGEENE